MNRHLKDFIFRGLLFSGFGPIILGIVFFFLEIGGVDLELTGKDVFIAIISTYVIAFVQAGASVFNQIEHWPLAKSLGLHFSALFAVYSLTYVINSWIPFEPLALLFFCLVFIVIYFSVWLTVYFSTKAYTKKMNAKIEEN
jgi:hypothetical protein